VREWFVGQGFRVATTSMAELIKALDEAFMSQEEYHAEWWRRQEVTDDLSLHTNLQSMYVRNLSGRAARRVAISARGRCTVPHGAVSSGLHVLSADGSTCEPLVNIPLKITLAAAWLAVALITLTLDVMSQGALPLVGWAFMVPMGYRFAIALDDADARLSHSPVLLPTLLVSAELSVNVRYGIGVVFVTSFEPAIAPLRRFLQTLGVASTLTTLGQLPRELEPSTLHIFVIQSAEDAHSYAAAHAGRRQRGRS